MKLNRIYTENCLSTMAKMPDNFVDMIVTSPPYNIDLEYDKYKDYMLWDDYLVWIESWLNECYRVLKPDGRICVNHYLNYKDKYANISRFPLLDIRVIQEKIGFNVHKLAVWDDITRKKQTAWGSWLSASAPFLNSPLEGILISYKKHWKKQSKGESTIDKEMFMEGVSGVWKVGTTRGKTPAQFPEKLPMMCIQLFTYLDDIVYDPFMGGGTTAAVCKKTGRRYIGSEISAKYCKIAKERLMMIQKGIDWDG